MSFNFYNAGRNPTSGLYEPVEYKLHPEPVKYHEYKTGDYSDPVKNQPDDNDKKKKKDNLSNHTIMTYNPTIERVSYFPYTMPKVDPLTGREDKVKEEPKKKEGKKEKHTPRRIQKRPTPTPKQEEEKIPLFPPDLGSSAPSVRRTLHLHFQRQGSIDW